MIISTLLGFLFGFVFRWFLQSPSKYNLTRSAKYTSRGFPYFEFVDDNGHGWTIQKSSSAHKDKIWMGISDPDPKIMSRDAIRLGLRKATFDERDNGWVPYDIPKEVLINTRMHLTQKQVAEMLPVLTRFAETGDL